MNPRRAAATVMVVDDVPANVRLLGEILRSAGHQVREYGNGAEALAAAAAEPPDLVLLDISMPVLDGFAVCERLKADDRTAAIPVIFISSLSETSEKVRAFKSGGVDYITKPFDFEEVLARVGAHLRIRSLQGDLEHANEDLTRSIARLRELEALRDSLVHMIVHDVRNPLGSISTFLYMIQKSEGERLSERGRNAVQRTVRSTEFLIELITTVLDVSKLESGQMRLNLMECDVGGLAVEVISRLEPLNGGERVELVAPEQPAVVMGDPQLLSRVLQNLVGNALAITSSKEGRVIIAVGHEASGVRVCVRDNGPGIPPEHREKVFEKFWQGEARRQRSTASTGLGLTFCKMVVLAHGGRIGVESEVGKGSSFWFELPGNGPMAAGPAD